MIDISLHSLIISTFVNFGELRGLFAEVEKKKHARQCIVQTCITTTDDTREKVCLAIGRWQCAGGDDGADG